MWSEDRAAAFIALVRPPAAVLVSGVLLDFLPNQVLTFLAVWALASFPIGVLIGHCVLSEEED